MGAVEAMQFTQFNCSVLRSVAAKPSVYPSHVYLTLATR